LGRVYLRGIVPSYPRPNPTLSLAVISLAVILHGSVFTIWMALKVAQTQLISARKHEIHMRLGKLTVLFAILMMPVMYLTTVWQVARVNQPPFTDPLTWTIVPLAVIIPFAVMVWQGWTHRRNAAWHKRSMICAAILIVRGRRSGGYRSHRRQPSASRSCTCSVLPCSSQ
jgi:cytochrome bd-type quinol oxidase subunit 2